MLHSEFFQTLLAFGYVSQGQAQLPQDPRLALDAYNTEVANQETLAEIWNVQRTRFLEMQQQ